MTSAYQYKPAVQAELERSGILPQPTTDPLLIREFLNDLYVYEISKLKEQQVAPGTRAGTTGAQVT